MRACGVDQRSCDSPIKTATNPPRRLSDSTPDDLSDIGVAVIDAFSSSSVLVCDFCGKLSGGPELVESTSSAG